jgi:LysM repeat protein
LPTNVKVTGNVVTSPEMKGELPLQNTQHYFDLTPDQNNGDVTLTLAFDPQDSSELARRLNFWLLDQASFNAYADPTSDVVLSEIALAAGSTAPGLLPNQRQAKFTASGMGPYVVIVYNNSTVPGNYLLTATGATLEDDSQQSQTAQQAISGGVPATTGAATTTDAATPAASGSTTAPAAGATPSAGSGIEGEAGGTYTVKAGDTLSLIAQAIYGELDLWDEICAFNNLGDCNNIEVGQEIRLPTREEIGAGIAPAATTAPAAAAKINKTTRRNTLEAR